MAIDDPQDAPEAEVFDLDRHRADRFLDYLAQNPFACVVILDDGSMKLVAKDIPDDELVRIRVALEENLEGT